MFRSTILCCGGTGCHSNNSGEIIKEFKAQIAQKVSTKTSKSLKQVVTVFAPSVLSLSFIPKALFTTTLKWKTSPKSSTSIS